MPRANGVRRTGSVAPRFAGCGDRSAEHLLAVFCGGVLGALARAGLVEAWPPRAGSWPWVTFSVNVAGAALVGWLASRYSGQLRGLRYRFWGSGLCGAMTTFSAMQLELLEMLDAGRGGLASAYVAASIAAGLAAVVAGAALGRRPVRL